MAADVGLKRPDVGLKGLWEEFLMEVLKRPDAKKVIGTFAWQTEELCAAPRSKEG